MTSYYLNWHRTTHCNYNNVNWKKIQSWILSPLKVGHSLFGILIMNDPTITKSLEEVGNATKGIIILIRKKEHTTKRNIKHINNKECRKCEGEK